MKNKYDFITRDNNQVTQLSGTIIPLSAIKGTGRAITDYKDNNSAMTLSSAGIAFENIVSMLRNSKLDFLLLDKELLQRACGVGTMDLMNILHWSEEKANKYISLLKKWGIALFSTYDTAITKRCVAYPMMHMEADIDKLGDLEFSLGDVVHLVYWDKVKAITYRDILNKYGVDITTLTFDTAMSYKNLPLLTEAESNKVAKEEYFKYQEKIVYSFDHTVDLTIEAAERNVIVKVCKAYINKIKEERMSIINDIFRNCKNGSTVWVDVYLDKDELKNKLMSKDMENEEATDTEPEKIKLLVLGSATLINTLTNNTDMGETLEDLYKSKFITLAKEGRILVSNDMPELNPRILEVTEWDLETKTAEELIDMAITDGDLLEDEDEDEDEDVGIDEDEDAEVDLDKYKLKHLLTDEKVDILDEVNALKLSMAYLEAKIDTLKCKK
jgi:hypothetical protein